MPAPPFDWGEDNVDHIWDAHEVAPDEAEQALADPKRVPGEAYHTESEKRYAFIGMTEDDRLLFVVFTYRNTEHGRMIRVISARDATPDERRQHRRKGKGKAR